MHQNVVAFHAANGMLNKDADVTQGFIRSLLIIAQLRVRVLCALARLLHRDVNQITPVVRLNTLGASVNPNMDILKPIQLRWKLLLQHTVLVMVTTKRTTHKDDHLVRERPDRVFQGMLFFFPL